MVSYRKRHRFQAFVFEPWYSNFAISITPLLKKQRNAVACKDV